MGKVAINFKTGTIRKNEEIIVGIDLGTTNSLISFIKDSKPLIIKDINQKDLFVPSIIYINSEGKIIVGKEAKKQLSVDPECTIYSVKRLMGKSLNDLQNQKKHFGYQLSEESSDELIKVKIKDKFYTPIELSSMILKHLKNEAELSIGAKIEKAVITVPAYFNDNQRQATRDAGRLAGLDVLRIVNEPTAASLAFGIGLDRQDVKNIAVYDLGGGTFDVSILRIEDGIFDVLATRGDTYLGGDDFDHAIIDFWVQKFNLIIPEDFAQKNSLRILAEEAKINLNINKIHTTEWNGIKLDINQSEFEKCTASLIQKTLDCCTLAIKDSGLALTDLDEVLLVGGSTRMQIVKSAVNIFFKKVPNDSLNPDEAVCLGASIQADILSGKRKDLLLLDVNPLSLGIETLGGLMDVIIPRNSKLPIHQARNYTTSKDGQVKLRIAVYQGERDLVEHNRLLGEFILDKIPPMATGIPKIEVSFHVDVDGILKVKAKELRSGQEQEIEIKSQFSLSPHEMARMLSESILHAASDIEKKSLLDLINEAEILILHTEKFLKNHHSWINPKTDVEIKNICKELKSQINLKAKENIQEFMEKLKEITTPLAHLAMDNTIQEALKGQKI
ncbi:MAG: Fe-S protein assembly chaperone HscA [Saprospiraceae bacterium]|nr:Fe-S protein assembly chaperone HscA [Candidatus Vicinibacter affinis]